MQPSFIVAILASEENNKDHSSIGGDAQLQRNETSVVPLVSKDSSLVDALMNYIERADDLIKRYTLFSVFWEERGFFVSFLLQFPSLLLIPYSFCWLAYLSHLHLNKVLILYIFLFISSKPRILLCVLNFMVALWQGAPQYPNLLESLRSHGKFWKHLANAISNNGSSETPLLENLKENDALNLAYSFHCQSAILGILAYELFLQKELLHAESLVKNTAESKDREQNVTKTDKSIATDFHDLKGTWSSWFKDSVLEKLIKSYTSCGYNNDIYDGAKVSLMQLFLLI